MDLNEKIKLLKSYHFPKQVEALLEPQLDEKTMGLCAAFVGNTGTNKRKIIEDIADFLFKLGKIEKNYVINLTLAEAGLEFVDNYMYSLVNIAEGVKYDKEYYRDTPFREKHIEATWEEDKEKDGIKYKQRYFSNINKESRKSYHSGLDILISQYRGKYIILNCNKKEYESFLNEDSRLSFIFSDIILFRDITNLEIVNIIRDNLQKSDFETEVLKEWVEKNRYAFPFENREFALYVANYMNFHNNILPKSIMRGDSSQKELEKIIGLDPLKKQIEDLKEYLQFKYQVEKNGIQLPSQSLHMLFLGNAGCGKTTIARIIAKIFYEIGICKENKLIEVSRQDLIGEYTGQTAPKTQNVINKAMNGILFIDEAYSLYMGQNDNYGNECIATLIKAMEDNKDKLIVIFAGYSKEMNQFINANSGISSRIGYVFEFPDYTIDELFHIYEKKMIDFTLTDEHANKVKELISYYHSLPNAGNGRLIDKLIQNILIQHSKNKQDLLTLTSEDVPSIAEMKEKFYSDDNKLVFPEMLTEDDFKSTAYHEIGHALLAYCLNKDSGVEKITIEPEASGALGYVRYKEESSKIHVTKEYYLNSICRLLAGRAAEEVILGKKCISSGCSSDIKKATKICSFFANIGFSETFGLVKANLLFSTETIHDKMQLEISEILNEQYEKAINIIELNKENVFYAAEILLRKKTLTGTEINNIFEERKIKLL